jgi:hypothetical protein
VATIHVSNVLLWKPSELRYQVFTFTHLQVATEEGHHGIITLYVLEAWKSGERDMVISGYMRGIKRERDTVCCFSTNFENWMKHLLAQLRDHKFWHYVPAFK